MRVQLGLNLKMGSNQCRMTYFLQILSLQFNLPTHSMSISSQNYRQRQGTSPFREKSTNRIPTKTSFNDYPPLNHQNSITQPTRFKYDFSNRELNNQPNYSAIGLASNYDAFEQIGRLDDRFRLANKRNKKQHQVLSYYQELESNTRDKRSKMNDFSFEDELEQHFPQGQPSNPKRDNARMKELEIKMNNIDSIHEKINDLLQLVKKDRSKDRESIRKSPNKSVDNAKNRYTHISNKSRPSADVEITKQKQNQYIPHYSQYTEKEGQRQRSKYDQTYQSPLKSKPLSIREQNTDRTPSYQPHRHQASVAEVVEKDQENAYSPPPRNKRKTNKTNYLEQATSSLTNQPQPNEKSIDDMINERRKLRNKKQLQKVDDCNENTRSNRIIPKYNDINSQLSIGNEIIRNYDNVQYSEHNTQTNQIREKISRLSSLKEESALEEQSQTTLTGRIYKKSEAVLTPKSSISNKKHLEITLDDF